MEWLDTLLSVVIGLVLRFAMPLIVTALIIIWLRWLDARWQQEADELSGAGGKASFWEGRTPCWDIRGCTPEMQASCPVFRDGHSACWQLQRRPGGQLKEECLGCDVFLASPLSSPAPAT